MNKEYLRKKCYKMGNSQLPLDVFYNDIRDNPNFDKELAYKDLEKVVNYIEKLQNENKELRKSIKSWNENAGNLLKENTKLKSIIKILKDKIELFIFESNNIHYVGNEYAVGKITQEQYELFKEILENE